MKFQFCHPPPTFITFLAETGKGGVIYYPPMSKFGLIIAVWLGAILPGLAAVAVAEASTLLTVSSTGPDCYADGSPVVDGEYYALVSIDSGANFAGFAADGTVVDPATSRLLFALPLAEGGCCPKTRVAVDPALIASGARLALMVWDTRRAVRGAPVVRVDGWGEVADSSARVGFASVRSASRAMAAVRSAVPADVPVPRITGIRRDGNEFVVTVEGTSSVLDYNVRAGAQIGQLNRADAAREPVTGDAARAIELRIPAADGETAQFFKVVRHGGTE